MIKPTDVSDLEVLALTIFGEARGESIEGQIAVGCVIRNRVTTTRNSYKEICLAPLQFSCWNPNDPNYGLLIETIQKIDPAGVPYTPMLDQCWWIAEGIISKNIIDNTNGSRNYLTSVLYNSGTAPLWARELKVSRVIGNQTFLV